MRFTKFTGGFSYEYPVGSCNHKKVIISAHPYNKFKNDDMVSYNNYYKYGKWYYYDGKASNLNHVLTNYNPETQGVDYLINRLRTEGNLEEYETTWETLTRWAGNIIDAAKKVPTVVLSTALGYVFGNFLGYEGSAE